MAKVNPDLQRYRNILTAIGIIGYENIANNIHNAKYSSEINDNLQLTIKASLAGSKVKRIASIHVIIDASEATRALPDWGYPAYWSIFSRHSYFSAGKAHNVIEYITRTLKTEVPVGVKNIQGLVTKKPTPEEIEQANKLLKEEFGIGDEFGCFETVIKGSAVVTNTITTYSNSEAEAQDEAVAQTGKGFRSWTVQNETISDLKTETVKKS